MIYLYWYLGIGAVSLAIIFVSHKLTESDDSKAMQKLLDAANPDRKSFWYRFLTDYVVMWIAAMAIVLGWPIAIYLKTKELLTEVSPEAAETSGTVGTAKAAETPGEPAEFAVKLENLIERLSVSEIELRERVIDPLGAVPVLPFGHLHAAWATFVVGMESDDAIWSFSAPWMRYGTKELRGGYVIVKGEVIGQHFLTIWKDVDEHNESELELSGNGFRSKLSD